MPTKRELKKLARTRLMEAKTLLNNQLYDGAVYLAGYSIELVLKARICKVLRIETYIENGELSRCFKTHNLNHLLKLSGLEKKFEQDKTVDQDLFVNWSIIGTWNEGYRYRPIGATQRMTAQEFIDAIENSEHGVFTWIITNW